MSSPFSSGGRQRNDAGDGGAAGSRRILATLFGLEIRLLLRDKRTIVLAVVVPLIIFPGMILLMRTIEKSQQEKLESSTYQYAVRGSQAELARTLIGEALSMPPADGDTGQARPRFVENRTGDADSLLEAGELHLVIEGMSFEEFREQREKEIEDDSTALRRLAEAVDVPVLLFSYRSSSEMSSGARRLLQSRLRELRVTRRARLLRDRGLPLEPEQLGRVESNNVATAEKESGAALGLFLTPLLVLLMLTGGSVVAADAISGEKERGTIETLLTTAARRSDIVRAKQLAIIAVGVTITVINVANLLVYVASGLFDLPERFAVRPEPLALIVILVLYLPLTAVVSAILLFVSGFSKTYREYQIYFFPVLLMLVLPASASVLPGIDLRSAIAFVPVANLSVAVKEVLVGEYDWLFLAITFAVTGGAAVYASRLTSRTLSTERLITAAELDEADLLGGPALFPKHVLRWFAMLWVVFFVVSLWFGQALGLRGQVVVNLVSIFLGGSLLMIRRYRLDFREALALRPVKATTWLAVLIGAPSAFLVAVGLARAANFVFPVPERLIEAFSESLLPPDMGLLQIIVFLTVLPGICEEIAFRGVLLHGLRKRFNPIVLCLVVGAIFGFFHVDLFRLVPTAYLGSLLAAVVLITGSIFPAMLWHALNNAVAVVPAYLGWWSGEPPLWTAAVGLVGLALAFWILWRNRSVYPGLRVSRDRQPL